MTTAPQFDPKIHKWGMAYRDMEDDIVYPTERYPNGIPAMHVYCPLDRSSGVVDYVDLTRAPEHDLIPRPPVTPEMAREVLRDWDEAFGLGIDDEIEFIRLIIRNKETIRSILQHAIGEK